MHTFNRRLHLFSGLILLVYVLMYFVTGYVMVHEKWFGRTPAAVAERPVTLQVPAGLSPDETAKFLKEHLDLRGKLQPPKHLAGIMQLDQSSLLDLPPICFVARRLRI